MLNKIDLNIVESELSLKYQSWFASSRIGYLLVFIAGAILPLAFSPVNFYLIALLSPAVLLYSFLFVTPQRAAWLGWWFGMGFFGVGVSWGFVAIYIFGLSSVFASAVLTFIGISLMAAFFALQGYVSVLFIRKIHIESKVFVLIVVFPLFWLLLEWFRGWFLTGFPWISLGYSQTGSVLSGYAAVLGVYGISWLTALSSSLLLVAFLFKNKKSIFVLVGVMAIWFGGYSLSLVGWTEVAGEPLKVSLIQGNVEQINKWDPNHFEKRKQRYLSLTRKHWDSDLVLWPENSLTVFHHQLEESLLKPLAEEAKKNNTDIILGLPVLDLETKEYFSSLMAINNSVKDSRKIQFYHKSHLVPFGEYIPLESLFRGLITFFDLPMSGFTPGQYDQKLLTAAGQKIAPTICYEDAFGEDLIRFLPEATLLLNASNNAWYGDSFAPHQHLQISQMRALETGRDMMRVTTNGVSALINHQGKITSRSPQFESYVVTGFVQPRKGITPYVRWGNVFVLFVMFFGLAGSVVYSRTKNS
ncbi:MAG: apolipoprotein N-acyltransferase [Gammaproteobacteria bacterium]|nr:apolipoprotein N-acyltransferase [Gammaproteobacteria bacterium]